MENWNVVKPKLYLRYLIILLLLSGIFFRFVNLDRKFYWVDEVFTSLRVSGFTETEVGAELYANPLFTAEALQKYQYPHPDKTARDTVNGLATREPQLPPLYFMMTRLWVQIFGNSVAVTRSFSIVCSLLVLPCVYWLCLELFESSLVAGIATALTAISPFHVVYAQEARPYSLWMMTIVLCSWALLRAVRRQSFLDWAVYAITLGLGFYTFLFSGFVALGHGVYVLLREQVQPNQPVQSKQSVQFRQPSQFSRILFSQILLSQTVRSYLFASLIGICLFIPWIVVLLKHGTAISTYTGWQRTNLEHGIPELFLTWGLNLTRLWIDCDLGYRFSITQFFPYGWIVLGIVGLTIYALCFLRQTAKPQTTLFIFSLIATTGFAVALPDLLLGGQRSATGRYLMPCYLGIQLAVAHLLATKLTAYPVQAQKIWRWGMVSLFAIGLLSCLNSQPARAWWNKAEGRYIPAIAEVINHTAQPLVLNELDFWLFSLSHSLKPETSLLIFDSRVGIPTLPQGYSNYFLFNASEQLIDRMQHSGYQLEPIEHLEATPFLQISDQATP